MGSPLTAIIGLTGTSEQIKAAESIYKDYAKADPKGFVYLIDRKGQYVDRFPQDVSVDEITGKLWPAMAASLPGN